MDRTRVLGVTGPAVPGSGYLITARLVLTSAHVVGEPGNEATVFRPGRPGMVRGRVTWRGTPGGRDDAALVSLERPAVNDVLPRVRWGRLVTDQPGIAGQTWGLPDVVQRRDRPAETVQPSGTINPGDRAVGHRYVLSLDQQPPHGDSPWGGLSGAALFCGDLLAGVIAADPDGWAHTRLEAVPAYVLLHDEGFRAALAEHVPDRTVLEPVEFQSIVEPEHPGAVPSAAALVQPRREIVPFRHRDELLDELLGWAELPGVSVRLVHGPGGQGKTRLARELASRLSARWTAVWLDPRATREQLGTVAGAAVPLLVVVDYAESRIDQLGALFESCARHRTTSPIKVLLLARTAGTWWETLPAESASAQEILDGAAAIPLPVLEPELDGRRTGYRDAVTAFAAALPSVRGHADIAWPRIAEQLPDPVVEGAGFQGALTLHMTALADLLDAAYPTAVAGQDGAGDVEDRLLVHERRYWTMIARARGLDHALGMDTLTDALIATTVLDAATNIDAHAVLTRVPSLSDQPRARVDAVRRWVADLYPPVLPERPWDALQPDRLAERFLGRHIQRQPGFLDHLVHELAEDAAERLLTVCSRAVGHPILAAQLDGWLTSLCVRHRGTLALPAVAVIVQVERPGPLLDALHQIIEDRGIPVRELEILSDAVPLTSNALVDLAAGLSRRLADHHRDANDIPALATSLHNLSARFIELGRSEESLTAITEAVGHYRTLADAWPDAFRAKLADGLINLAGALSKLGRREEGLAASREAVGIYRTLADAEPDEFRLGLADALNGLARDLEDLDLREEALETITEAAGIHRAVAAAWPDAIVPGQASSLDTLARLLDELGRHDEAMAASTEAVGLRRTLAEALPDLFRRGLATSLNTWSGVLVKQGRHEEALAALREAVDICRPLAAARPEAIGPELAILLKNVSYRLSDLDRPEESLAATAEAVEIYRRLAVARPEFRTDLADSLDTMAVGQWDQGRPEQALTAFDEAVDISRKLPDGFIPRLAGRLNNLASRFAALGYAAEAAAASTEAVEIHRRLADEQPGKFRSELAGSLDNHAMDLDADGRRDEAVAASTEAVEIYRQLRAARPDDFLPELAGSLNTLSGRLLHAGQQEPALTAITEAVDLRRRLAASQPETFRPSLAASLQNLSHRLAELNRIDEALTAITEAVDLHRRLAADEPATFLPDLAASLNSLSLHLWTSGRREEAIPPLSEAKELHCRLVVIRPEPYLPGLVNSMHVLANRLAELGRLDEAQTVFTDTSRFLSTARPDLFPPDPPDG